MSPTVDSSAALLLGLLSSVIGVAVYVWMALALGAMFRKMGEDVWKAWVPVLNVATVLRWGGFSPWLVLLGLIPGIGQLAVVVLVVVSAHRINPGFGYGGAMTVLAALLFLVWATVLGFGPAPWRGARRATPLPPPTSAGYPVPAMPGLRAPGDPVAPPALRATGGAQPWVPPAPPTPGQVPLGAPAGYAGGLASAPPPPPAPAPHPPGPAYPGVAPTVGSPAGSPPASGSSPYPTPAPGLGAAAGNPGTAPRTAPGPGDADPDIAAWPSEVDEVSAVSPSPFPPSAAAPGSRPHVPAPAGTADGIIAFVPGRTPPSSPPPSSTQAPSTQAPSTPPPPAPPAPVTRLPVPPVNPEPDAPADASPARGIAPLEADAFPELTGEVSAVVGSPAAGAPLSARRSVSAQQREVELDEDDVDNTVMVRRRRPSWQLIPASGQPIAVTADVAILGRRPAADPAFPQAQLIAVQDGARTVSKTHARIELRGERWLVTDLGSTNGVLVRTLMGDEVEVEPGTELDAGERFFLGDEEFHLQHAG